MNPADHGGAPGRAGRIRLLAGGILEIVETRLELLGSDIELQGARLRSVGVLLMAGLLFFALALVFGSVLVIAAFWETHRLAAIAAVAGVHLLAAAGCLLVVRRLVRSGPRPFEASLAELRHDIARLRS
ncbi:MAG: phage holin family protein [Burkholderiaceae bacterium]|nr:phage holin family protein [Burkholderiaceae bacterium]